MASGYNQQFMKQKDKFLENHFLIFNKSQELSDKGVYEFDITDAKEKIVNASGKQMKAVVIWPFSSRPLNKDGSVKRNKRTNVITAYYLPYGDNRAWHHRLVEDVDYFFTDTLNGCTFVVDSNRTTPFVSHYNYTDANQKTDQAKIDRHIAARYNTPGRHVAAALRKSDYKTGTAIDYKVTVVGFRGSDGQWRFCYQRRAQDLIFVSKSQGSVLQTIAADTRVNLV